MVEKVYGVEWDPKLVKSQCSGTVFEVPKNKVDCLSYAVWDVKEQPMTKERLQKIIRDLEKCVDELTEDQYALFLYVKDAPGEPRKDFVELLVELHEEFYP